MYHENNCSQGGDVIGQLPQSIRHKLMCGRGTVLDACNEMDDADVHTQSLTHFCPDSNYLHDCMTFGSGGSSFNGGKYTCTTYMSIVCLLAR